MSFCKFWYLIICLIIHRESVIVKSIFLNFSFNIQRSERIFTIFFEHRVHRGAKPTKAKRDRVSIHGDLSFMRRIAQTKGDVIAPRVDNDDHRQWVPRRLYVIANKRRCAGSRGKFDVSRVRMQCTTSTAYECGFFRLIITRQRISSLSNLFSQIRSRIINRLYTTYIL